MSGVKKAVSKIAGNLPPVNIKRLVTLNIPYVIVFYLVDKAAWLYRHCLGDTLAAKLGALFLNFELAFTSRFPSLHLYDLAAGMIGAAAVKLIVWQKGKNAKKYRQGVEYGSARWGA